MANEIRWAPEVGPDGSIDPCSAARPLAARIREESAALAHRWLDRISELDALERTAVFPSDALLDHVPQLIEGIADFLDNSAGELDAVDLVIGKALELGELRHEQGVGPSEILKEFEILGGILLNFMGVEVRRLELECRPDEAFVCAHRIHRSIAMIERYTTTHYLRLKEERINEREQRLRGFNRMVSHELKNRVGAIHSSGLLLQEDWLEEEKRKRLIEIVAENSRAMGDILADLLELSGVDTDSRRSRDLPLRSIVAEVTRQLRDAAAAKAVEIRVADDLPDVTVSAPVVELALTNYISNAIKYSDPEAAKSWALVRTVTQKADDDELRIEVEDNGIGVSVGERPYLFKDFFRAESVTKIEGSGIGLSIVRGTIEAAGGEVWARFPEDGKGSIFGFSIHARRESDEM